MMAENIHQLKVKQAWHKNKRICDSLHPSVSIFTYRVAVGILGLCCLPIVGIPLFLPWLNDDELRGIELCPLVKVGVAISIDDDGWSFSTDDWVVGRRCDTICVRDGVVNGLLLTSFNILLSFVENCRAVNVVPKSFDGFLAIFCVGVVGWTLVVLGLI